MTGLRISGGCFRPSRRISANWAESRDWSRRTRAITHDPMKKPPQLWV